MKRIFTVLLITLMCVSAKSNNTATSVLEDYFSSKLVFQYRFFEFEVVSETKQQAVLTKSMAGRNTADDFSSYSLSSAQTDITIPEWVQYNGKKYQVVGIGKEAFAHCEKMVSVSLPPSIEYIEEKAFGWCNGLSSIRLNNGLKTIGKSAFYMCGFKSIALPASVDSIAPEVFWHCDSLTSIEVATDSRHFKSVDGIVFCKDMSELICMPHAFKGSYTVPNGVKRLADWSMVCEDLTEVKLPESLEAIGENAFFWDTKLKDVKLPKSLRHIGKGAFLQCHSLKRMTIPEGITTLLESTFYHCDSLKEVVLPKSLKTIDRSAFSMCNTLGRIALPDGLTSIGSDAFSFCRALTEIQLPANLKNIEERAFTNCSNLKAFKISDKAPAYSVKDGVLFSKDGKTLLAFPGAKGRSYTVPEGVERIAEGAFQYNDILSEVTFPCSLLSIGKYAFSSCDGLIEITIPTSIENIGEEAFSGCYHLKALHLPAPKPSLRIGANVADKSTVIYVPSECVEQYKNGGIISKGSGYFSSVLTIKPEHISKPIQVRTTADLTLKLFGEIAVNNLWSLTVNDIAKKAAENGVEIKKSDRYKNCITNTETALLKLPSTGESFRVNYSRFYHSDNNLCVALENSISCEGSVEALSEYLEKEILKLKFKRQKNKTGGYDYFMDEKKENAIFIIPDPAWARVFVLSFNPKTELFTNAVNRQRPQQ